MAVYRGDRTQFGQIKKQRNIRYYQILNNKLC